MNATDKLRMTTKHTVLGTQIIQDCGVKDMINSCIESIDDHIKDNLKRDSDHLEANYLRGVKSKLESII